MSTKTKICGISACVLISIIFVFVLICGIVFLSLVANILNDDALSIELSFFTFSLFSQLVGAMLGIVLILMAIVILIYLILNIIAYVNNKKLKNTKILNIILLIINIILFVLLIVSAFTIMDNKNLTAYILNIVINSLAIILSFCFNLFCILDINKRKEKENIKIDTSLNN